MVAGIALVYLAVRVPLPDRVNNEQTTVVYAADGTTELGRLGTVNRTDVPLADVPVGVRQAVLAAEDRRYYSEPGISLRGIARALWADVRGKPVQGGSTITQQYVKNAYLTQERTLSRKLREIVLAVKIDRTHSKDQVLEYYLNTIYFGRGAYGIEAAAHAYFGIPASRLTTPQGAVLAGLIRNPAGLDPANNPQAARTRYGQVTDAMVQAGWLDPAAAAPDPPATVEPTTGTGRTGPSVYLMEAVKAELAAHGVSEDVVNRGGLRVVTTIDPKAQQAAEAAVLSATAQTPATLQEGLVAVQPGTGEIRAYFGGKTYDDTRRIDNASFERRQPGSSFKPIVLAAALKNGIGLDTRYEGRSPQVFPGYPPPGVSNFAVNGVQEQFGDIDLVEATAESVNTVYVHLGLDVGLDKVVATAHSLGIPQSVDLPQVPSLSLGVADVSVVDMAAVYGAFASGGTGAPAYLVSSATDPHKHVVYSHAPQTFPQALGPDGAAVAADATVAMRAVVDNGTGRAAQLAGGRPAAGKTGTTTDNKAAWFCGYTPQLAAAVAVFDSKGASLRGVAGYDEVTGGTVPSKIWKSFMDAALDGVPVVDFPPRANVGTAPATATPTATPSSTRDAEPSGSATAPPTTPVPTQSPRPSGTPTPDGTPGAGPSSPQPVPTSTPTSTPPAGSSPASPDGSPSAAVRSPPG